MKLLFCDTHDVLNHKDTKELIDVKIDNVIKIAKGIEEILLEKLVRIVKETGAKLVLHGTWRNFPDAKKHFEDRLDKHGVKLEASTVCLGFQKSAEYKVEEIDDYLLDMKEKMVEVEKFAIIDDDWTVSGGFGKAFFHITGGFGITDDVVEKVISYLNS